MKYWDDIIAHSYKSLQKFMEVVEALAEAWGKVYETVVSAVTTFTEFDEKVSYIGDDDLSPRQYGEQLSWGKHGRPYKAHTYPYIAVFKRNLPYQRRPQ